MKLFAMRPDVSAKGYVRPDLTLPGVAFDDQPNEVLAHLWTQVMPDGCLPDTARKWISEAAITLNKGSAEPLHIAGQHGVSPSELLAVSEPMAEALAGLDAEAFDFVPLSNITVKGSGATSGVFPMLLAHPRCEVDAVDTSQSKLKIATNVRTGFKPGSFRGSKRVFAADRLPERAYFRDANTGYGICTPAFRQTVEALCEPPLVFLSCSVFGV